MGTTGIVRKQFVILKHGFCCNERKLVEFNRSTGKFSLELKSNKTDGTHPILDKQTKGTI